MQSFFTKAEVVRVRFPDATDKKVIGLVARVLAGTADENGGREARRQRSAVIRAAKTAAIVKFDAEQQRKLAAVNEEEITDSLD